MKEKLRVLFMGLVLTRQLRVTRNAPVTPEPARLHPPRLPRITFCSTFPSAPLTRHAALPAYLDYKVQFYSRVSYVRCRYH